MTYVDTSGYATGREGNYSKGGKIRLSENFDLEILTPRKVLDQLRSVVDQLLILDAHLLVNYRDESCMTVVIITSKVCESTDLPSHSARLPYGST